MFSVRLFVHLLTPISHDALSLHPVDRFPQNSSQQFVMWVGKWAWPKSFSRSEVTGQGQLLKNHLWLYYYNSYLYSPDGAVSPDKWMAGWHNTSATSKQRYGGTQMCECYSGRGIVSMCECCSGRGINDVASTFICLYFQKLFLYLQQHKQWCKIEDCYTGVYNFLHVSVSVMQHYGCRRFAV